MATTLWMYCFNIIFDGQARESLQTSARGAAGLVSDFMRSYKAAWKLSAGMLVNAQLKSSNFTAALFSYSVIQLLSIRNAT